MSEKWMMLGSSRSSRRRDFDTSTRALADVYPYDPPSLAMSRHPALMHRLSVKSASLPLVKGETLASALGRVQANAAARLDVSAVNHLEVTMKRNEDGSISELGWLAVIRRGA